MPGAMGAEIAIMRKQPLSERIGASKRRAP
jgi:hypothetical protein